MNLLLSCPPVYHLSGTWSKCDHALIPHGEYAGLEPAAAMAVLVLIFLVAVSYTHLTLPTSDLV